MIQTKGIDKGIVDSEKLRIKWSELIRFKRAFTEPYPKHREEVYEKAGIIPFHGHANFIGSNRLKSKITDTESGVTALKVLLLNIPGS